MYSFDERKRAIERLIELDWDYKETVKDLGYPTQSALVSWVKIFLEKGKIPLSKFDEDTDPHFYNAQQRCRAVRCYFAHGRSLRAAISALGYPDIQTLKVWIVNLAVLGLKKTEEDICQGLTDNVRDDASDEESYMDEISEEQLLIEFENLKRKNIA